MVHIKKTPSISLYFGASIKSDFFPTPRLEKSLIIPNMSMSDYMVHNHLNSFKN